MRQRFAEMKMQNRDRLEHHEQELSQKALNATEQAISRNSEALRRQEAQQEREFQQREELVHQVHAEKLQHETQRMENHERATRYDLERQKITYEQKRQEAYAMLDAIRAETATQTSTANTSEEAANQQAQREQLHREQDRLQREGQRLEQVYQDLHLEEQAVHVMATQEMQRKIEIAEQIAEAQADLKREEIHREQVLHKQSAIAATQLLEEHSAVQKEREVVQRQPELQLEAQRHIHNKHDQLEAKEAAHQRATLQHQLFFNEAQEEHRVHHVLLEKTLREQLGGIAPRIDADMLDSVVSAVTADTEKQNMRAQADEEEAHQRDYMRSALHAIAPSHELGYDVAELGQMATPKAAALRGVPSSSGSSRELTSPFYCSHCQTCGKYTSCQTEIIRCRHCGSESLVDRSAVLGHNGSHPLKQQLDQAIDQHNSPRPAHKVRILDDGDGFDNPLDRKRFNPEGQEGSSGSGAQQRANQATSHFGSKAPNAFYPERPAEASYQEEAKIHLFTDGSKHPKQPGDDAWSVVIVGDDNHGFSFQGAIVGKHKSGTDVALQDGSDHETTSTTVEITAPIWAFAWVPHYNPDCITTIFTGSLGALQLAKRLAFTAHDPNLARALCMFYDMVSPKIDLQHVHAHEHNPWNEVADDAAANRGRLREVPVPQPEWASIMDGAFQRGWEFLLDAARHFHKPTESSDRKTEVEINIATFNIQSGREPKEGSKRRKDKTNKLKTTMASLCDEDPHIIGIQEARTPWGVRDAKQDDEARCANVNSYHIISSGHKGFNYGCELHVLLSKPYGKCDKKALEPEKVLYWQNLTEATEKYQVSIIFFDASARTGNLASAAIGDQGFQQNEDPNGRRLHELLPNRLAAANTFVSHGPERHTWHSGKDPHRIDYVIIPESYIDSIDACSVLYGIDGGQDPETKGDHYPVKLQLAYEIVSSVTKGIPKLDESKLADEECRKKFSQKLSAVQRPPWATNLNDHLTTATVEITEAAHECFRSHGRAPHKPYITKRSFALLRVRRSLLKTTRIAEKNGVASHFGAKRLRYTAKLIAKGALLPYPADAGLLADLSDCAKLVVASLAFSTPSLAASAEAADASDAADSAQRYFDALVEFLRTSKPTLHKWITRDRGAFLDETADEMGTAIDDHAPREEALHAKRLLAFGGRKPKKPPTPPIRSNNDGKPLTTKSGIADHALAYYCKIEQAIAADADGVAADYNKRTSSEGPEPKIQNITPKHQLTSQLAAAKRGRRGGPDQLTDDMSRAAPERMARLLRSVLVKIHFECTEPIAAKGGYSTPFHKGQGAMEQQKSYRGILLNNTIGKMHSGFLRSRVKGLLPELLEATQSGARPKMATDFITHTSLAFISDCQERSRSCSIAFLDIREAFHSVIKEFCMQLPTSADELNDLIEIIVIPDFLRPALKERLQQPAYNDPHIGDDHLCHMIADHHATNWMTAKNAQHYQLPRASTRPGVPYPDVAFNAHFAIVLRASDQAALADEADGQPTGGHEIEACSAPNQSFVDDLTGDNSTDNAGDLIQTTTLAATRLCTAAFQNGLKPRPDKTKAILMHYGERDRKEKQRIAKEGITHLELDGLSIKVQLVIQQKSLGTIIAAGGVTGPEICARVNRAHGAARPLEKQILRREKPSKKAKVKYVHSFSSSSLTYNHHVWGDLAQKGLKHIATKYMGPHRVAASMPKTNSPDQHIADAEAVARTGAPDFSTRQTAAHLRYLPRLLNHAPAALLQLLDGQRQRKGTWSRQLKRDFDFLRKYLPRERWPSQTQYDCDVISWARQKPKPFTNAVTAAVKAYLHHARDQAQNAKLQKDIQMLPAVAPAGMAVHMGRDHPDHTDPRFWATGTACRCCQTEHHTFPKLMKHHSVAHRCRKSWHAWHHQTMGPLTEQQLAANFNAIAEATTANRKQGRRSTFSDKPAYQCDVTPLPLLETSPVAPRIFARLESSPSRPPVSTPAGPAERQEVVFITDRPRQAADPQQIMANSGITCNSGLDYSSISTHSDG
ncbi:unnamed protein product, partial [Prorocentrum cordatum]